ncbi:DUF3293 domain-containing protein [Propionivibrio sp.]|uniref:DUF3293 domain-containing protein n=1 Tax=Propionivibrio sp. TaxID=2212460 RepID=UPI00261A731D|nr:DUF3293 domain-containing protein [Propionivibrio sp.]
MKTPALDAAFRATSYRVDTATGMFDLRIGVFDLAFDNFLRWQGVSRWGIVTACNPAGIPTPNQNAERQSALLTRITALGWRYCPAVNHAHSGGWPDEPGFCVLDADEAALCILAADFGQLAVVCGEVGKSGGRLVWL